MPSSILYGNERTRNSEHAIKVAVTSGVQSGEGSTNESAGAYSYSQLLAKVIIVSELLKKQQPACVALYADNSPSWVVVDLACQDANIPFLPLPLYFSPQQLEHAVDACGVDLLLTDRRLDSTSFFGDAVQVTPIMPGYSALSRSAKASGCLPDNTQKITFTSGSTGHPKGVCLSIENQLKVAQSLIDVVNLPKVRHLCLLPLTTLLENIAGVYAPLIAGGEVIIPPLGDIGFNGSLSFSVEKFLKAISVHQPQSIILMPQLLATLVAAVESGFNLPNELKFIAVGGAKVSAGLLSRAHEVGLPVYEGYGLSECASVVSLSRYGDNVVGAVGKILNHNQVSVSDGELIVSGNCFLGYAGKPETWYPKQVNTGDVGTIDGNGFLSLSGRSKNILISRYGRNISPEWIEGELMANVNLSQAVVVGDDKPYCSALIFCKDLALNDSQLAAWIAKVNRGLPDYAKVMKWKMCSVQSLMQHNLVTGNGRPKREQINKVFERDIESLYTSAAVGL